MVLSVRRQALKSLSDFRANFPSVCADYVVCDLVNEEVYPVAGLASSGIVGEFHLKAQVVDYFPAKMEEWLIAYCDGCGDR